MIDPGTLRSRLVLEAPVETPDGAGGVARTYTDAATLWASVTPRAARDETVADAGGAAVTHRVVIRARADVTTRHRLRAGTRIFTILAVRDLDGEGRFLAIDATERTD